MMRRKNIFWGQSTIEFAMLLPIAFALLYGIFRAYHANSDANESSMQAHSNALVQFNHGNANQRISLNGVDIPEGRYEEIIPDGFTFNLPRAIAGAGAAWLSQVGINQLFARIPFLNDSTIAQGFAKGFASSAATQFITIGKVDLNVARNAGFVEGLSTDQADRICQGNNGNACTIDRATGAIIDDHGFDLREFIGSGVQGGLVAWAQSGFDQNQEKAFLAGAFSGMLHSDSSNHWFESGNDILKGAAKGALAGSISGITSGKLDWTNVGKQAAMGAFYTKSVARTLPWTKGLSDPRTGISFGAVNAAVSVLVNKGDKVNVGEVALAAAGGAFSSGQMQTGVRGTGSSIVQGARVMGAQAAFSAGVVSATGGNSQAVGQAVVTSLVAGVGSAAVGWTTDQVSSQVGKAAQGVKSVVTGKEKLKNKEGQNEIAGAYADTIQAITTDGNPLVASAQGATR